MLTPPMARRWPAVPAPAAPRARRAAALAVLAALLAAAALAPAFAPAAARAYELHLNCGSIDYTSQGGTLFEADRPYSSGDAGYVGGWNQSTWQLIGATPDQALYSWVRWNHTEYRFDLPNDDYLVTLHLVDIFSHSTGEIQFDVLVEGQPVLSDLDIYGRVRRCYAIDFTVPAQVTDGQLNVEFHPDLSYATIAAISVVSRAPDALPPAPPQQLEVLDSYGAVMLRWAPGDEDDLAGYVVERAAVPGGPFLPLSAPGGDLERLPWRIDAAAPGETWYYRLRAVDAYGNQSDPTAAASGTVLAHAAASLPLVEVIIDPVNLEILDDDPSSDLFVPCMVQFDGSQLFTDALCRYRGNVARSLFKKSWKLKLQTGVYDGRDNFNLNAEYIDKSLLRERVAYQVLRRAGALAPLTRYVHMILNDTWMGVNLDVENVNKGFLRRVGLEDDLATMYKIGDNLDVLPTVGDYMAAYEKELGDPADYSDLITFIEELNQTPADQRFNWLVRKMNLNRLFDFYSAEVVLQNNDITFKNWFLHHDLATDRWTPIPWDVDLTFGDTWPFSPDFVYNSSIHLGNANRLFQRISQLPVLKQLHYDRVRQILVEQFAPAAMTAQIDSAYTAITGDAELDWWKWGWSSSELFHQGPAMLDSFVTLRADNLLGQIAILESPEDLVLNEVMASNNTAVTDEWGDYDDWVELYNRGNGPVSTLGLYLTDDLSLPGAMALPDTTLQPGERLVIWCDAEPFEGPWHAPFKLDVAGEEVGLFSGPLITDAPLDVRVFDNQFTDASYGRLPDGSPYWQVLPTPTAGAPNVGGGNIVPQIRDITHFPPAPATGDPVSVTARIYDDGTITTAEVFYDAGGGFVSLPMADDGQSGDGAAGDEVYGATIPGQPLPGTVRYYLRAFDDMAAVTVEPPGAPDSTFSFVVGYAAPALYLNEFMASNDTTVADEWGDFDDWVELYNGSAAPLALGGMHLTDDFGNPTKWVLPDTTLAAGGFLLLWCDGEPLEGPLHAPFKLAAAGEELGLFDTAATGVGLIDTLSFGPQVTDVSRGRVPDGGTWQVMPAPTPGGSNNQIGVAGAEPAAPAAYRLRGPFPNPFNPSARLEVELPAAAEVEVTVVDVLGRQVRTLVRQRRLAAGRHVVRWDGRDEHGRPLPSGVYWIRLVRPGGQAIARAVLVR